MYRWYVVRAKNGSEQKIKSDIQQRLETFGKGRFVRELRVPTQERTEMVDNKQVKKTERVMPGYILLHGQLEPSVHNLVLDTKGVSGFLGGDDPVPLSAVEVERLLGKETSAVTSGSTPSFKVGQSVSITEGPFTGFNGEVSEVDEGGRQLKILAEIFGRQTPITVSYAQVRAD